jgi:hypothetical protein
MVVDAKYDKVLAFLQSKPKNVATNKLIVTTLKEWITKEEFIEWRKPYLAKGLLVKTRGQGGATTIPTQMKKEVAKVDGLSIEAKTLLDLIPLEGPIGNTRLQAKFGKPEEDYWRIRQELLHGGWIKTGKGKGGSVSRTQETLPKSIQKAELVEDETEIYEPLKKWLEEQWGRDADEHGDYYRAKVTSTAQGRKRSSGQWSRPDVTYVRVNNFDYLPSAYVEVTSFEVKRFEGSSDLSSVYEAAAHQRWAHYTYLVIETTKENTEPDENIVKECDRLGVGIMLFTRSGSKSDFKEYSEAKRQEPAPEDIEDALEGFFKDDSAHRRKFRSSIGK